MFNWKFNLVYYARTTQCQCIHRKHISLIENYFAPDLTLGDFPCMSVKREFPKTGFNRFLLVLTAFKKVVTCFLLYGSEIWLELNPHLCCWFCGKYWCPRVTWGLRALQRFSVQLLWWTNTRDCQEIHQFQEIAFLCTVLGCPEDNRVRLFLLVDRQFSSWQQLVRFLK